jgi:DNA polymerase-3 subunit beta
MEFEIDRAVILNELGRAQSLAESKAPIPSLECVLMESGFMSTIKLTTTNVDNTLISEIDAVVLSEGQICTSARSLYEAVRLMPDGPLRFQGEPNHWVNVSGGETKMRLPGMAPEDFVRVPPVGDFSWMNVGSADMSHIIHLTEYAMAKGEMSNHIYGAGKLEIEDGKIRMVCSDGRRFSLATAQTSILTFDNIEVLIPARAVGELSKLIGTTKDDLSVAQTDNHIFFRLGHRTLIAVKLAGQFPQYQKVFSAVNYPDEAEFAAAVLAQSVKRVALISEDVAELIFSKGSLRLNARSAKGECHEQLALGYEGRDVTLYCNPRLILEFLAAVGNTDVHVGLMDSISPLHFSTTSTHGVAVRYILLPLTGSRS